MKKILALFAVLMMFSVPANAWTYDGIGSLNPFTNFGRGFGCGCERPRLTKCEKLHGVKIIKQNQPTGCAAPIVETMPVVQGTSCDMEALPVIIDTCPNCKIQTPYYGSKCRRAF